jgi:hypothetical protein
MLLGVFKVRRRVMPVFVILAGNTQFKEYVASEMCNCNISFSVRIDLFVKQPCGAILWDSCVGVSYFVLFTVWTFSIALVKDSVKYQLSDGSDSKVSLNLHGFVVRVHLTVGVH